MMIEFPRLCSSHRTYPNVLSRGVKEDYARLVGVPIEEAEFFIDALGAVIQDRLVRGLPCGIPFVGTIFIRFHQEYHVNVAPVTKNIQGVGAEEWRNKKRMTMRMYPQIKFKAPNALRHFVRDHAMYTGGLEDHYHKENGRKEEINAMRRKMAEEMRKRGRRGFTMGKEERITRKKRKRKTPEASLRNLKNYAKIKEKQDAETGKGGGEEEGPSGRGQKRRRGKKKRSGPSGKDK